MEDLQYTTKQLAGMHRVMAGLKWHCQGWRGLDEDLLTKEGPENLEGEAVVDRMMDSIKTYVPVDAAAATATAHKELAGAAEDLTHH